MSFVHFATELTGGAGNVVRNIHIAMQEMGLPSLVITREENDLSNSVTIKPLKRIAKAFRARWITFLGRIGVIQTSYLIFGIEKSPVGLSDVQLAIGSRTPTTFIFYWLSYFISFQTVLELRRAYPKVSFVFVCLDEAFLTGGCHYSNACVGYQQYCNNCPATSLMHLQNRIAQGFSRRKVIISTINPIVIYPTTNIQQMGKKSAVFKSIRSAVIPLGAISHSELSRAKNYKNLSYSDKNNKNTTVTLLIRSSSEYRKGCDLFISALKIMSEQIPDLRTRLQVISIGDDTLLDGKIDRYVKHTARGYVKRDELMLIYNTVNALIVTSREDGGPLMINECVALGVFVISTPIGVAKDLIEEKQNGLITREISREAIVESLTELIYNYKTYYAKIVDLPASEMLRASLTFEGYIESIMVTLNSTSLPTNGAYSQ